jgi:hypothetical protein
MISSCNCLLGFHRHFCDLSVLEDQHPLRLSKTSSRTHQDQPQAIHQVSTLVMVSEEGHTCVTRKQIFILERTLLSGTTLYDSGCASSTAYISCAFFSDKACWPSTLSGKVPSDFLRTWPAMKTLFLSVAVVGKDRDDLLEDTESIIKTVFLGNCGILKHNWAIWNAKFP